MTSSQLQAIKRGLAIGVAVGATLAAVPVGRAESITPAPVTIARESRDQPQPDVEAMIAEAKDLQLQGDYAAAAAVWQQLLNSAEQTFGPDHSGIAIAIDGLASAMHSQGEYAATEHLYRRALTIKEKTLSADHPDIANSLNNLASLLLEQGHITASEIYIRRAIAIQAKALDQGHPDTATSLDNLARFYFLQGQRILAEDFYRRSLSIREKALGFNHPDVASSLNNLAGLLNEQGQYGAAELFFQRALDINEKAHGPDHSSVATTLNNLALLLINQGQYDTATSLFRRVLVIDEKTLGPDHPYVATSLNNLALLLNVQGRYGAADPLYRRALAIYEKVFGQDHPEVARTLNNLAALLSDQGKYAEAKTLYHRSLTIREANYGPDHPDVAISLNNFALLLSDQGQYSAAESHYRRSFAILEKAHGSDHPAVVTSLNNLAVFNSLKGLYKIAVATLAKSLENQLIWLIRELPLLPDGSRFAQLNQLGNSWQVPFSWIASYPPASNLALETRLNRHGLLQEIEQRQSLLLGDPGIDPSKVQQLQALTQQLASVTLPAERRAAVRQQRDALQAEIYRLQPDLEIQMVTIADVASALPADGALVEIQRYRPFDGRKRSIARLGKPQYVALVLKPNGAISTVPLGAAAPIDAAAMKALSASAQDQGDAGALWAKLSEQLINPLLPHLSGSRQWFLSSDGELNRVPFAALPAPQQPNRLLADVVQLRVLTTGRDLVRLQTTSPKSHASLVVANPSFDRGGSRGQAAARRSQSGAQHRSTESGSTRWDPLPGTEREGKQVAGLLGASLLSGPAATATALMQQQSPQVLHVATHGFFLADQDTPPTDPLRVVQEQMGSLSALRGEAPLLRSGLVLAGANQPAADPKDDGHLTAAEILKINLKGTELVVLSACSTGQGEVRTGEGVYGLQRALTVAGARSTLLSLWKVDDAATAEFMVRFYRRLKAGEGRADALAAVQAEFRGGAVKGPMGEDWSTPYYWAAWQLAGDWGPIPGL
jgi:CHAT domain-containing protein/tetratricopeptide (TPR) repeat protein